MDITRQIIYYLFIVIIILIIIFFVYIKLKHHFWSIQPVFHFYDLHYYILPPKIIKSSLPEKNRYCNFREITTFNYYDLPIENMKQMIEFIQNHYNNYYCPKENNIVPYFKGNNNISFISLMVKDVVDIQFILNNNNNDDDDEEKNKTIKKDETKVELVGCITSKPINIYYTRNNIQFIAYYCDWLTVSKTWRKKGIAQQLIQTHEYNQRHLINNKINVSLFKRESNVMDIIPITYYEMKLFCSKYWSKHDYDNDNFTNMKVISIGKSNFNILVEYIQDNKNKYHVCILCDYSNLLELILSNNIYAYLLINITTNEVKSMYLLKHSSTCINGSKNNENDNSILILIASIKNKLLSDDLFLYYFKLLYFEIILKIQYDYLAIEELSDNWIISKQLELTDEITNKTIMSYYYFNYAYYTYNYKKVLIII
jgi:hypothetical protein